jgi:uncharacterized protein (TIGR02246 family)
MRKLVLAGCACLLLSTPVLAQGEKLSNVGGASSDIENEKLIRKLYSDFEAAWNRHDAAALAAMWTIDGDHLEPDGTLAKGKEAVSRLLKAQHDTVFKNSTLNLSIEDVWFITTEIALIDGGYELTGVRLPDGTEVPARKGHLTAVLLHEKDHWAITASRLMIPAPLPYKK